MKQYTFGSDYWQTGADLMRSGSNIITKTMGNQQPRLLDPPSRRSHRVGPARFRAAVTPRRLPGGQTPCQHVFVFAATVSQGV